MPTAEDTQVYLELTQYSLRAVRATGAVVEAAGECVLENKASLEALLDAVAPAHKTTGIRAIATVWPAASQWYLSTDTEAMLDRTEEALKAIAAGKQKNPSAPFAYAVCSAGDGAKVTPDGMDKWVLAFSPLESLGAARKGLADLGVDPQEVKPAGFAGAAAVSAALGLEGTGGSVVLWDVGTESSNLILVTAKGVEGTAPCGVGMEGIYEAVQIALKLKFRGAGARLFFNESYDFTDPGPKVGAIVGAKVREALAELPPMPDPPRLACMGVTGKQAWFIRVVAAVAGLTPWEPDVLKFVSEAGLTFADGVDAASFSATSAGILGLIAMRVAGIDAWNVEWAEAEGQAEEVVAPPPPVEEEPEPEPVREPEPPVRTVPAARPKPSLSIDTQQGSGAPARLRPTVAPKSVTSPPMPVSSQRPPSPQPQGAPPPGPPRVQMRPMSAPAPASPPDFPGQTPTMPAAPASGAPAMSFPTPGGAARPPSFSNPGFPAPGAPTPAPVPGGSPPSFPSRAAQAPSFPTPGTPAPSFPAPGKPAPPVPASGAPAMSFPTPGGAARPPSFSNPGFPIPGAPAPGPAMPPPPGPGATANPMGADAPPARAVTALPFEAVRLKGGPAGATKAPAKGGGETTPPVPPPPPKSRVGFFIGVGVAGALVFAGIAVVVEARLDRIRAHDLEQQEELKAQIKEQELEKQEKLQKAQQEADEKERAIEVAAAKKRAEEETKAAMLAQFEQDRLAKLPGTILVATTPAGASVSIDGAAPLTSPVKASGLQPGNHTLHITLAAHDPVDLTADLKGNSTLDMGTVALQASFGSLDLTSSPDGLDFTVRAAGDTAAKPVHSGRTPASFDDIVHGDYVITFSRPSCHDHMEKATVEKGAKTTVTTTYVDGSLELSSDPSGANVNKDGSFLGTTPLTLHDLTPKLTPFVLTLPGYDSTPITCDIPEGQTLTYSAQLLRRDRIFSAGEVKTPPVKLKAPAPVLSAGQRQLGGNVVISFVVTSDGLVRDVQIVSASDDDIARRCKAAVEQWKYGPATAPDDRVVDSRVEVPFKFAAGAP